MIRQLFKSVTDGILVAPGVCSGSADGSGEGSAGEGQELVI